MQTTRGAAPCIQIGNHKTNILLFADDIALVGGSIEDLQKLCDAAEEHSRRNFYRFEEV